MAWERIQRENATGRRRVINALATQAVYKEGPLKGIGHQTLLNNLVPGLAWSGMVKQPKITAEQKKLLHVLFTSVGYEESISTHMTHLHANADYISLTDLSQDVVQQQLYRGERTGRLIHARKPTTDSTTNGVSIMDADEVDPQDLDSPLSWSMPPSNRRLETPPSSPTWHTAGSRQTTTSALAPRPVPLPVSLPVSLPVTQPASEATRETASETANETASETSSETASQVARKPRCKRTTMTEPQKALWLQIQRDNAKSEPQLCNAALYSYAQRFELLSSVSDTVLRNQAWLDRLIDTSETRVVQRYRVSSISQRALIDKVIIQLGFQRASTYRAKTLNVPGYESLRDIPASTWQNRAKRLQKTGEIALRASLGNEPAAGPQHVRTLQAGPDDVAPTSTFDDHPDAPPSANEASRSWDGQTMDVAPIANAAPNRSRADIDFSNLLLTDFAGFKFPDNLADHPFHTAGRLADVSYI